MKTLCAIISAFLLSACGAAQASNSNYPKVSVEYIAGDSARIIASWKKSCDIRGCADLYNVDWAALNRPVRSVTKAVTADTYTVALPNIGDSLQVRTTVTASRRSILSSSRSVFTWVKNPDSAPPAVDSLRLDTLAALSFLYEEALADSFPVKEVRTVHGTIPSKAWDMLLGDRVLIWCILGRNRYTGEVRTFVPADTPDAEYEETDKACGAARTAYASEKSG